MLMLLHSLRARVPGLVFSEIQEKHFARVSYPARIRHFTVSGWITLLVYNGFLLVDWCVSPGAFDVGWKVRLMLFTPMAIVVLLIFSLFRRRLLHASPLLAETIVAMAGVAAAASVAVVATSEALRGSSWSVFYHAGFVATIVYGNVVQRLRFRTACLMTLLILGMHWVSLAMAEAPPGAPIVPMLMFLPAVAAYTLVFNYRMELEERQRYQQKQRAKQLRAVLDGQRHKLEQASYQDPLTGVANRRGLDRFMAEHWKQAGPGQPFALLLLDIDHFKSYNDGYGHPAGDECLRQVARILGDAIPHSPALLARWGGEEFLVALPSTDADQALQLARQLCAAVRAATIRHAYSPDRQMVTVSIGVACSEGLSEGVSWSGLLAQADQALYRAKADGRNCAVLSAPGLSVNNETV